MKIVHLLSILSVTVAVASGAFPGEADLVTSLPGVSFNLNYRHFSGYLESNNNTFLHYWFYESQTGHSEKDPVVLWLNGGPGCSSLLGALTELGPIRLNSDDKLTANPHGWNQHANILFLESPGGVGFSFKVDGHYNVTDSSVAELNLEALRSFYKKFPHFAENDFYITGESYAGIYIPTLSMLALEHKYPKHFKGVAIGNGYLDVALLGNSLLHYYFHHGMVGSTDYHNLLAKCCPHSADVRHCDIHRNTDSACHAARSHLLLKAQISGINPYNIYDVCAKVPHQHNGNASSKTTVHPPQSNAVSLDYVSRAMIYESLNLPVEAFYSDSGAETPVCADHDYLVKYLNSAEVKQALHIDSRAKAWSSCRGGIGYHRQFDSMKPQVKHMVDAGLKVIIFNGDIDTVCNFVGDEWFTDELGFHIVKDTHPWTTPSGQTGGYVKVYEKKLLFVTVLGAGHMVPEDKGEAALKLFNALLSPFTELN